MTRGAEQAIRCMRRGPGRRQQRTRAARLRQAADRRIQTAARRRQRAEGLVGRLSTPVNNAPADNLAQGRGSTKGADRRGPVEKCTPGGSTRRNRQPRQPLRESPGGISSRVFAVRAINRRAPLALGSVVFIRVRAGRRCSVPRRVGGFWPRTDDFESGVISRDDPRLRPKAASQNQSR